MPNKRCLCGSSVDVERTFSLRKIKKKNKKLQNCQSAVVFVQSEKFCLANYFNILDFTIIIIMYIILSLKMTAWGTRQVTILRAIGGAWKKTKDSVMKNWNHIGNVEERAISGSNIPCPLPRLITKTENHFFCLIQLFIYLEDGSNSENNKLFNICT
jgi:hypothetical protein